MITGYFGLPGCGKSTFLSMICQRELKRISRGKSKYKRVFTNFQCDGAYVLDFKLLGRVDFSDSLILLDELTLSADSRDFKNFSQHLKEFFLLHRHYGIDIIYATQQYDGVDKKIRDCTAQLYYLRKLPLFSYATIIHRTLTISEIDSEIRYGYSFPSKIISFFSFLAPWLRLGVRKWCFRRRYFKYFDSYEAPALPQKTFEIW